MLDVLELEKKWSKYHFKKMLPLYITSFITITILITASFLFIEKPYALLSQFTTNNIPKENIVPEVKKKTIVDIPTNLEVKIPKVYKQNILTPSFQFIDVLDTQTIAYQNSLLLAKVSSTQKPVKRSVKKNKVVKKPIAKKKTVKKPKKKTSTPKTKTVKNSPKKVSTAQKKIVKSPVPSTTKKASSQAIVLGDSSSTPNAKQPEVNKVVKVGQNTTSKDQLRGVIKRFNKTKKPALSLFISKKYYEQGNYKEAYVYAKKTYKINPNIEDGVLLYARSLAKLGKNDAAVKKLKPFIKKSGSIKAKILLTEIQQGTFK